MSDQILSEHMAPQKTNATPNPDYQPSVEEKKDLKLVDKLFQKAKKYRSQYDVKWLDYYKMFRGRQWKEQRPTYRHSEVLNLIFQCIQSQLPIITDTRPKFEILPQEPSDYELADILNDIAKADWERHNWLYALTETLYDMYIYGTGLSCLKFDPETSAQVYESADPFYSFPDPGAKDVNKRANYFIYAEPMEITTIREKWPDKGKYVKPDLVDLMRGSKTDLGPVRYKSPTDSRTLVEGGGIGAYDMEAKDQALVFTIYLKSCEYEEIGVFDSFLDPPSQNDSFMQNAPGDTITDDQLPKQNPREDVLKYPNGKKITVANGVVLESGPNPYDHGEFPYQRIQNYILPREFWGISEIENLDGPQKTFNKIISFVMDVLTIMGNPIWLVDNTSGIDTENLINRPGSVVEKEPNSVVTRVEGVQLQPFVLQVIDRYKEWFDQIAGANDITRGVNPSGVTAASAIESLQNAAQTRIRQKSRNLDAYLEQVGEQWVSNVFQFYTAPQIFRLTNKDGSNKYFKFHVDSENQKAYMEKFSDEGLSQGIDEYQIRGKFDVRVTTGSSLPFAKGEKMQTAFNLFDRQIIDDEEVLKTIDYPNYEAVLQRVQQKKAQAAAAQGQAQGGGAQQPSAGAA